MTDAVKKPIAGSAPGGMSPLSAVDQKSRDSKGNLPQSMYPSSRETKKPDAATEKPAGDTNAAGAETKAA